MEKSEDARTATGCSARPDAGLPSFAAPCLPADRRRPQDGPARTYVRLSRDPRGDARDRSYAPSVRLPAGRRHARTQGAHQEPQEALPAIPGGWSVGAPAAGVESGLAAAGRRCRCRCDQMTAGRWTSSPSPPSAIVAHPPGVRSAPPDGAWTYRWLPARHRAE